MVEFKFSFLISDAVNCNLSCMHKSNRIFFHQICCKIATKKMDCGECCRVKRIVPHIMANENVEIDIGTQNFISFACKMN